MQHLANRLTGSCEPCTRLEAVLDRIQHAGAGEVTVPEHVVRSAEAVFRERRRSSPPEDWALLPRLAADPAYSSLDHTVRGGERSDPETLVEAVFHAGDYAIDLQIEPDFEAGAMAVVGQVVNRTSGVALAGVTVRLMARAKVVATAQTNGFGEFCLVSRWQRGMGLAADIELVGVRAGIALDNLVAGLRL